MISVSVFVRSKCIHHVNILHNFYVRELLTAFARLSHRNSVCPFVHHTGGSVKNGAS